MEQITPKDAITLLDKVTSTLKLDRNEHTIVIQALQVLLKLEADYQLAIKETKPFIIPKIEEK